MMLSKDNAVLIIIDFQEKLMPYIEEYNKILENACKIIRAAKIFGLPILITKQRKLGEIVKEIKDVIGNEEVIEKITFSCYKNKRFAEKLDRIGRKQCIIIGIEAHICVLQTSIDIKKAGYEVHVAVDCTGSRKKYEKEIALKRMLQHGIFLTTAETAIYEMLVAADAKEFKEILSLVKSRKE